SAQATLDRYVRGEDVSLGQLREVWRNTTPGINQIWEAPVYAEFFAAVRGGNRKLPAAGPLRVLRGDAGPGDNSSRETHAFATLREQVLERHGKALVVYGAAHFYRNFPKDYVSSMGQDIGLARMLESAYPGRTLVVVPVGGLARPSVVK